MKSMDTKLRKHDTKTSTSQCLNDAGTTVDLVEFVSMAVYPQLQNTIKLMTFNIICLIG